MINSFRSILEGFIKSKTILEDCHMYFIQKILLYDLKLNNKNDNSSRDILKILSTIFICEVATLFQIRIEKILISHVMWLHKKINYISKMLYIMY